MFGDIARRYDLLNHLLSGNIDKRWRTRVVRSLKAELVRTGDDEPRILDVACGTGDLSLLTLFENCGTRIMGIDFSRPMLEIAASKALKNGVSIPFIEGDGLELPFSDQTFDAVTIAFGLRNFASVTDGLKELRRVLKPGGKLFVLEFSRPANPILRAVFKVYFTKLLPLLGGLISGSKSAYEYLPDSVSKFPDQKELAGLMAASGFIDSSFQNLTGGIAALHTGTRRGS